MHPGATLSASRGVPQLVEAQLWVLRVVGSNPISPTSSTMADAAPAIPRQTLFAVFLRFLRFGCLAWGGPVAQIAMIRRELVEEERWITPERFGRALAVYQVLPGPEAHELC